MRSNIRLFRNPMFRLFIRILRAWRGWTIRLHFSCPHWKTFHKLDRNNLEINCGNHVGKNLTWKLCNVSLSNEHLEITILPASFPLKAEDKIVTSSDFYRKLHNVKKRKINDLVCLQNSSSKWISSECYFVLTYHLKIVCQYKLMVWFVPSVEQ